MVINWTRYDAAGKRVVVVVQRGLLLVDGLVEHVHVEDHMVGVQLGQGVEFHRDQSVAVKVFCVVIRRPFLFLFVIKCFRKCYN